MRTYCRHKFHFIAIEKNGYSGSLHLDQQYYMISLSVNSVRYTLKDDLLNYWVRT